MASSTRNSSRPITPSPSWSIQGASAAASKAVPYIADRCAATASRFRACALSARACWLAVPISAPLAAMSACRLVSSASTCADVRPCTTTLESAASRWPPSLAALASSDPNAPGDVPSTMPKAPSTSRSACARASANDRPLVFSSVLMAGVGQRGEHVDVQHRLAAQVGVRLQRDRAVGGQAGDLVGVAARGGDGQQRRAERGIGRERAGGRRGGVRVEVAGGREVDAQLARGDRGADGQRALLRHAGGGGVGGGGRHGRGVALGRAAAAGGEQRRERERGGGGGDVLQAAKGHGAADSLGEGTGSGVRPASP